MQVIEKNKKKIGALRHYLSPVTLRRVSACASRGAIDRKSLYSRLRWADKLGN